MEHKVLCVLRISTDRQDIADQKKEMIEYCKLNGYAENEIIPIEGVGASAIKLNDEYMQMINKIKMHIENKDCDAVAVWHINRLGRNDDVLINLKNYFITNKVQFICKNPSLKLLNEDGSLNTGSELAYSLFATMCKQDMEEKKAKFKRAKKGNTERGKWNGGYISYGYKVDENNFIVVDEDEAKIVKEIYTLYSTGKYSYTQLCQEFKDRGITYTSKATGKVCLFNKRFICHILNNKGYIGQHSKVRYKAIITEQLFQKAQKIKIKNSWNVDKSSRHLFATKLLKCPVCGRNMSGTGTYYECSRAYGKVRGYEGSNFCNNSITVNIEVLDGLLWYIAASMHMDYLMSLTDEKVDEYKKQLLIIQEKIDTCKLNLSKIQSKKDKVVNTYLEDLITKEDRDKRLAKIDYEAVSLNRDLISLKEDYAQYENLINSEQSDRKEVERWAETADNIIDETDNKKMYDIIHKHIKEVNVARTEVPRDYDTSRTHKALLITIIPVIGSPRIFSYSHHAMKDSRLKCYNESTGTWSNFEVDKILRERGNNTKAYTSFTIPAVKEKLDAIKNSPEHLVTKEYLDKLEDILDRKNITEAQREEQIKQLQDKYHKDMAVIELKKEINTPEFQKQLEKINSKAKEERTPEEKLLNAIFNEPIEDDDEE